MKKGFIHIVSVFLLLNLFFTQVVSTFMHNHERGLEFNTSAHKDGVWHKQEDKCAICSLDLSYDLFYIEIPSWVLPKEFISHTYNFPESDERRLLIFLKGRAPPLV